MEKNTIEHTFDELKIWGHEQVRNPCKITQSLQLLNVQSEVCILLYE